jgi:hypothetical protein
MACRLASGLPVLDRAAGFNVHVFVNGERVQQGNRRRAGALASAAPLAILVVTCLVCLVPFLGKPAHIDDPLFIWTAQQIQRHPLDFFGFSVNWYGTSAPPCRP